MKKTVVAALMGMMCSGAYAASMEDISISGFGSVAVGKSNNDVGYAGYDSENFNTSQDTLAGIQLDAQINDRAKFVGQVVSYGRYDYDLSVEMAYLSYELDWFTVRAGKLRAPLFMYSDYLDVGYAYPMLRPSVEVYDNFSINSYTGVELLIPIEFEDSSLLIQPLVGISGIAERDSKYGEITLNDFVGLAMHWYVEDYTFRASYVQAQTEFSSSNDDANQSVVENALIDDKKGTFASIGAQYDNGSFVTTIEATDVRLEDEFGDVQSVSGFLGYRFGTVMPYVMANWMKTSDDDERDNSALNASFGGALDDTLAALSYKTTAYSLGARWDLAKNIAWKVDVTYADFHDTTGGIDATEDDTVVYSTALDFIF